MNYRVRNIRFEYGIWIAQITTWEGCCSNIKITGVTLEQEKRPSNKDFIKALTNTPL